MFQLLCLGIVDDHEQLSTRVRGKATRLGKMRKRACHMKNQRSHRERESLASESTTKWPQKWSWTSEGVEILIIIVMIIFIEGAQLATVVFRGALS